MNIDGIDYKFYEIEHPVYVVLLAENVNQAYESYLKSIKNAESIVTLEDVKEVSYEYVKRKFELNHELVNHGYLLDKGLSFSEIVKASISDEDMIVLFDYDLSFVFNGGEIDD